MSALAPDSERIVLALRDVTVRRDGRAILDSIDWEVRATERWVILGPNGSGKTTLLAVAGGRLWPTAGTVEILGSRLGTVDVRALRSRVAFVSAAVTKELRPAQRCARWWRAASSEPSRPGGTATRRPIGPRPIGCSQRPKWPTWASAPSASSRRESASTCCWPGRSWADPSSCCSTSRRPGSTWGRRERLLAVLASLGRDAGGAPLVLVTHHTEEIPEGVTHAVLMSGGRIQRAGPVAQVLTSEAVSECFSVRVVVRHESNRWWSQASGGQP